MQPLNHWIPGETWGHNLLYFQETKQIDQALGPTGWLHLRVQAWFKGYYLNRKVGREVELVLEPMPHILGQVE